MSDNKGFKALKEKEREERKKIIRESTIKLLDEKPVYEISMREIAEKAGISMASIYRFYPSQEDLFVEILIENVSEEGQQLVSEIEKKGETVEEFALNFIDRIFENDAFLQIAGNFMVRGWGDVKSMEKYKAFEKFLRNLLSQIIVNSGMDDENQKFTKAFLAAILGISISLRNDTELTLDQKRNTMYSFAKMLIRNQFTIEFDSSK